MGQDASVSRCRWLIWDFPGSGAVCPMAASARARCDISRLCWSFCSRCVHLSACHEQHTGGGLTEKPLNSANTRVPNRLSSAWHSRMAAATCHCQLAPCAGVCQNTTAAKLLQQLGTATWHLLSFGPQQALCFTILHSVIVDCAAACMQAH